MQDCKINFDSFSDFNDFNFLLFCYCISESFSGICFLLFSSSNIQNINFWFVLILRLTLYLGYKTWLYLEDRFLSSTPSDVYLTNIVLIRIHCGVTYKVLDFFNNN